MFKVFQAVGKNIKTKLDKLLLLYPVFKLKSITLNLKQAKP